MMYRSLRSLRHWLGPMDEAARGMILRNLEADVPEDRSEQYAFFDPDLTGLPQGEANYHKRQATNLKRSLVDKNGLIAYRPFAVVP